MQPAEQTNEFKQVGFTALEFLIALAIASILIMIAAPAFTTFINKARLNNSTNDLVRAVNLARSEAIKRSSHTTLCPSSGGSSCDSKDWNDGWLLFNDINGNGALETASGETVIRVGQRTSRVVQVTADGAPVRFSPYGFLVANASRQFSLCVKNFGSADRRDISIRPVGRPKVAQSKTC